MVVAWLRATSIFQSVTPTGPATPSSSRRVYTATIAATIAATTSATISTTVVEAILSATGLKSPLPDEEIPLRAHRVRSSKERETGRHRAGRSKNKRAGGDVVSAEVFADQGSFHGPRDAKGSLKTRAEQLCLSDFLSPAIFLGLDGE